MEQMNIEARLGQLRDLVKFGVASFDYEAILELHYRRWVRAGDTVIDIGAHKGRHLAPLLQCVGQGGRVIAFEPLPFAFEALAEKFCASPATIHNVALGTKVGNSDFVYARGTPEESGLRQRTYNNPAAADPTVIEVRTDRLDNYTKDLTSVSFIKIDVEGGEIDCLAGAIETMNRFRPVISVEYGKPSYSAYGNTKETLFELAKAHSYVLFDIFLNRIDLIEDWHATCDFLSWDYFMVPVECCDEFVQRMTAPPHRSDRADLEAAATELASARIQLTSAEDTLQKTLRLNEVLQSQVEALRAQEDALRRSTSWRLTAPIRAVGNAIRRRAFQSSL